MPQIHPASITPSMASVSWAGGLKSRLVRRCTPKWFVDFLLRLGLKRLPFNGRHPWAFGNRYRCHLPSCRWNPQWFVLLADSVHAHHGETTDLRIWKQSARSMRNSVRTWPQTLPSRVMPTNPSSPTTPADGMTLACPQFVKCLMLWWELIPPVQAQTWPRWIWLNLGWSRSPGFGATDLRCLGAESESDCLGWS